LLLVLEELNVGNNFLWLFLHVAFEQNLLIAFCMFSLCFCMHFSLFCHYVQSVNHLRFSKRNIKVIIDIRFGFHIIPFKSYKIPTFLPLIFTSYYSWIFCTCCNWILCHCNNVVGTDPISFQNNSCSNCCCCGSSPLCPWSS